MKTITDVIRLLGRRRLLTVQELTAEVYKTCKEHGLTTHNKNEVTTSNVEQAVKRVLSNVRHGRPAWKGWGLVVSDGRFKLFKGEMVEVRRVKKRSVNDFLNVPVISFETRGALRGEPRELTSVEFVNSRAAREYYDANKDVIITTRIIIGDKSIETEVFE